MTKEIRVKTLQYLGILTLSVIFLFYLNELFTDQIRTLFTAINAILLPFGIALFVSYLLSPIINLLETKLKIKKRWISVLIVFLLLIVVGGIFVYFIGDIIYTQADLFFKNDWEGIKTWALGFAADYPIINDLFEQINEILNFENASPYILSVFDIFRSVVGLVVVIVLVPVFLFFLLKEKETVFAGIITVFPKKQQVHVRELGIRANEVIQKYFNGRFLSMLIISILFTIMFMIFGFGFNKSIFFGFILGFLDIIPYIGGFIGLLLPVLNSFTLQDDLLFGKWTFIAVIIGNGIIQLFQGNILQPYIMGKEVNMHPLLVLSSFIFFGALFGITGIILAIPITGIIKTSVQYFNELKEKQLEPKKV